MPTEYTGPEAVQAVFDPADICAKAGQYGVSWYCLGDLKGKPTGKMPSAIIEATARTHDEDRERAAQSRAYPNFSKERK